ncbi:MAG: hypothetical protein WC054_01610 [Candidatus Nanopelagicales bacterium]
MTLFPDEWMQALFAVEVADDGTVLFPFHTRAFRLRLSAGIRSRPTNTAALTCAAPDQTSAFGDIGIPGYVAECGSLATRRHLFEDELLVSYD